MLAVIRSEVEDERYQRVVSLSHQHTYWGYRKIYELLWGEELAISRERVRLIRRREGASGGSKAS